MLTRLILSVMALALLWAAGLVMFIARLPEPAPRGVSAADGLVVYTGGGARIATGLTLLREGAGRRLLISGVHPDFSRSEILALWPDAADMVDCCVDLGDEARTTEGNAEEVRAWATANGFDSLILVTSDYHMPRALVETRARLAGVDVRPYAAPSEFLDADGRPASPAAWRALGFEYTKFLAARVKTLFRQPS